MKKTALFGSSFNPPHLGHLHLLQEVQKYFGFDVIKVIPVGTHPLSPETDLPPGRLELVQKIFKNVPHVEVEDREIKKAGISWTTDTLKSLSKENPTDRFFIIMGLDQWAVFDQWKNFKSLLKKAHMVVVNRQGHKWPESTPPFIKSLMCLKKNQDVPVATNKKRQTQHEKASFLQTYSLKKNHRTYGRDIYYLDLKGWDISSSEVRARFGKGKSVEQLVPKGVREWLESPALAVGGQAQSKAGKKAPENSAVPASTKASAYESQPAFLKGTLTAIKEKLGKKIRLFDLRTEDRFPFDWTVVVSGLNTRHTKALAEYLKKTLRESFGLRVQNTEGSENGEWIVLDYGDMVVHVFYDYTREYYRLEELWQTKEVGL